VKAHGGGTWVGGVSEGLLALTGQLLHTTNFIHTETSYVQYTANLCQCEVDSDARLLCTMNVKLDRNSNRSQINAPSP
jgi:hypothetical protein